MRGLADVHSFAAARLLTAVCLFALVLSWPIGVYDQTLGAVMLIVAVAAAGESAYAARTARAARRRRRVLQRFRKGDERLLMEIRSL